MNMAQKYNLQLQFKVYALRIKNFFYFYALHNLK